MHYDISKGKITYMIRLNVALGKNSYEIRIGSELLPRLGPWLKERSQVSKVVIITDTNVRGLYADSLVRGLETAGFRVTVLEVPPGEEQKTLATAGQLYHRLAAVFTERNTPILALGGGVIGDLAGFVAATYMRGVPYIQVPTSLLAMADSSIGGKTAVDYGAMKNLVGAFYQPRLVMADVTTLKTLPRVELANGMGEVIKHAAIRDRDFFGFLQRNMAAAMEGKINVLADIVAKNARIKALYVTADEKETGPRMLLNFGHTVGHAVEAVTDFKIKHGQAVAIGMMAAARISWRSKIFPERELIKLEKLIRAAELPVDLPDMDDAAKEKLIELIKHDKKVKNDKIRFILLKAIGSAYISEKVDTGIVREVLFGRKSS